MTAAKFSFDSHIKQCDDAISIYHFLSSKGYAAEFGLRFVWVAAVSALDHYITELIVEKATQAFSSSATLTKKLLNETVPFATAMTLYGSNPVDATVYFHSAITLRLKYRTFQKADDVADGLAYIWENEHKWAAISGELGLLPKAAKRKLNTIVFRRDTIVHNADYDSSSGTLLPCSDSDAAEVVSYIRQITAAIDKLVP